MFINCTQHNLTPAQLAAAEQFGQVAEFRDLNPDLFGRLARMQGDEDLNELATEFGEWLATLKLPITLHLPIGTPAFMYVLARQPARASVKVVFSFSLRRSEDVPQPDGTIRKQQVFDFQKFLEID